MTISIATPEKKIMKFSTSIWSIVDLIFGFLLSTVDYIIENTVVLSFFFGLYFKFDILICQIQY